MSLVYKMGTVKFYPYQGYDIRTAKKVFDEICADIPIQISVIGIDRDPYIGWHFNLFYSSPNIKKVFYKTNKSNEFKDKRIYLYSKDTYPQNPFKDKADTNAWRHYIQYIEKRQRQELERQITYTWVCILMKHSIKVKPHRYVKGYFLTSLRERKDNKTDVLF